MSNRNKKELENMHERIEFLTALVIAVKSSEFDGFSFEDVNGENWFDAQDKVIKSIKNN